MSNPLLKAAGITPDTKGHSAERALFDAAWKCVEHLRDYRIAGYDFTQYRACCDSRTGAVHVDNCLLVAFDEAAKFFQEDV